MPYIMKFKELHATGDGAVNSTARVSHMWYDRLCAGDRVVLWEEGSFLCYNAEVTAVYCTPFFALDKRDVFDNNTPACRNVRHLQDVLRECYPGVMQHEPVTIVRFRMV